MEHSWRAAETSNTQLIDKLVEFGIIETSRVEKAMKKVDRGGYTADPRLAYFDMPSDIGHGATISAPHMHARALETLADSLKEGSHALDVGSGSGYLTSCMAEMVGPSGSVLGIDIIPELVAWSQENTKKNNPSLLESGRVKLQVSDGWDKDNLKEEAYDAIHVGAAAATVPDSLMRALKKGGRMVIPVGAAGGEQELWLIEKEKNGEILKKPLMGVRYVPLINLGQKSGTETERIKVGRGDCA